jgi:hypothetical protein
MKTPALENMSLIELKQLMKANKRNLDYEERKKIKARISYMYKENRKALRRYKNSRVLKAACGLLRAKDKGAPVIVDGKLKGYEYDLAEVILKVVETAKKANRKVGNKHGKGRRPGKDNGPVERVRELADCERIFG